MHARAVDTRHAPAQVQQPGKARGALLARAGLPARLQLRRDVGVGQRQAWRADLDLAIAADAPAQLRVQAVEGDVGVFEHAGKAQHALAHLQRGAAAGLRQFEVDVGAAHTGHTGLRGLGRGRRAHRQRADAATGAVGQQRLALALPARLQPLDQARRRVLAQHAVRRRVQRQTGGHLAQHRQVQPVGLQPARRRLPARRRGVANGQVAARPAGAVAGLELQALGFEVKAVGHAFPQQAPGQRAQVQRRQLRAQRCLHLIERHVGGHALRRPARHVDPGAQRATALLHVDAHLGVAAQLRHVDVRKIGIGGAAPLPPVAGVARPQRPAELAHPRETLAPARRRRGLQLHPVAAHGAVAQHHVHLAERQRRRGAFFVHPAHAAAAQRQLGLGKDPVGQRAVVAGAARGDVDAGHQPAALAGAAHLQLGLLDHHLLETHAPQRTQRQRRRHARQRQRHLPAGAKQFELPHLETGHQRVRARLDRRDAHRQAQRAACHLLDARPEFVDTRHNDPVQHPPGQHQHHAQRQHRPQQGAHHPCRQTQRAGRHGRGAGGSGLGIGHEGAGTRQPARCADSAHQSGACRGANYQRPARRTSAAAAPNP